MKTFWAFWKWPFAEVTVDFVTSYTEFFSGLAVTEQIVIEKSYLGKADKVKHKRCGCR